MKNLTLSRDFSQFIEDAKSITAGGISLDVPKTAKFIAVDRAGFLFAFDAEPTWNDEKGEWLSKEPFRVVAEVRYEDVKPEELKEKI